MKVTANATDVYLAVVIVSTVVIGSCALLKGHA